MSIEQERAEFEAWYMREFEVYPRRNESGGFRSQYVNAMFKSWKGGRAALQSQDLEDAERFRFCLKHGFPQKWEEMIRGSLRHYWTSRPGSQEEFSSAIEAIDHARRVEGEL